MNLKFRIYVMFALLLALKLSESAKALIRADSLKVKGSKFMKAKMNYQNAENGSFIVNATFRNPQAIDKEMVILVFNKTIFISYYSKFQFQSSISSCFESTRMTKMKLSLLSYGNQKLTFAECCKAYAARS